MAAINEVELSAGPPGPRVHLGGAYDCRDHYRDHERGDCGGYARDFGGRSAALHQPAISAFNSASSRAVALNERQRIRFDPSASRFFVEKPDPRGASFLPESEEPLDPRISVQLYEAELERAEDPAAESAEDLAEEESMQAPGQRETIVFYPDGTADAKEIVLTDKEGFHLTMRINPITARVDLQEKERP